MEVANGEVRSYEIISFTYLGKSTASFYVGDDKPFMVENGSIIDVEMINNTITPRNYCTRYSGCYLEVDKALQMNSSVGSADIISPPTGWSLPFYPSDEVLLIDWVIPQNHSDTDRSDLRTFDGSLYAEGNKAVYTNVDAYAGTLEYHLRWDLQAGWLSYLHLGATFENLPFELEIVTSTNVSSQDTANYQSYVPLGLLLIIFVRVFVMRVRSS